MPADSSDRTARGHLVSRDGSLSRRSLLSRLALGLGSFALAPAFSIRRALAGVGSKPKFLLIINQNGGNDGINSYVPYGLGEYYDARPNLAVPAAGILPIDPGSGLNPLLSPIYPMWGAGDLAIVRQVGYPNPNLSHFESMDVWSRGVRDAAYPDPRGWIGRAADLYLPGALDVVALGEGRRPDFVANTAKPLILDTLASYGTGLNAVPAWDLAHRDAAVKAMLAANAGVDPSPGDDFRKTLRNAYDLIDVIRAADASYTSPVTYPSDYFGTQLRDVAKLVHADVGTRIFYTVVFGWDTHADQGTNHPVLLTRLADGIAAFKADLEAQGAWDRAAILVITEFGRRHYENASDGTDHGHGSNLFAFGGGIHGGVYGPAYTGSTIKDNEMTPGAVDFRAIYKNIVRAHLGLDPAPVFPEAWSGDQEVPLF